MTTNKISYVLVYVLNRPLPYYLFVRSVIPGWAVDRDVCVLGPR